MLALTIADRERILRAMDEVDGLGGLRAVLLQEHEWRKREGSCSRRDGPSLSAVPLAS